MKIQFFFKNIVNRLSQKFHRGELIVMATTMKVIWYVQTTINI